MKEKHIREQIQILKDQLEEQMKHTDEYADRLMESEAQELQLKKNYDKVSGHTCHTSYCEIKSDKISQNLALVKVDTHKIFKSQRIFRTFKNTFYKEIIINHTLLCLSQASYINIKAYWS